MRSGFLALFCASFPAVTLAAGAGENGRPYPAWVPQEQDAPNASLWEDIAVRAQATGGFLSRLLTLASTFYEELTQYLEGELEERLRFLCTDDSEAEQQDEIQQLPQDPKPMAADFEKNLGNLIIRDSANTKNTGQRTDPMVVLGLLGLFGLMPPKLKPIIASHMSSEDYSPAFCNLSENDENPWQQLEQDLGDDLLSDLMRMLADVTVIVVKQAGQEVEEADQVDALKTFVDLAFLIFEKRQNQHGLEVYCRVLVADQRLDIKVWVAYALVMLTDGFDQPAVFENVNKILRALARAGSAIIGTSIALAYYGPYSASKNPSHSGFEPLIDYVHECSWFWNALDDAMYESVEFHLSPRRSGITLHGLIDFDVALQRAARLPGEGIFALLYEHGVRNGMFETKRFTTFEELMAYYKSLKF